MKSAATTPTPESVVYLRLAEIAPAPDNIRVDVGDVTELAASIANVGVLEPIIVVRTIEAAPDGKGDATPTIQAAINGKAYTVVVGHRRLAGAKLAGIPNIPAIIRQLGERDRVEAMLVENLQRQDLEPLEEAEAFRRLLALGIGQIELSKRIGRSQAHVSKRLALLKLPAIARTALAAGKLILEDALALIPFEEAVIDQTLAEGFFHGNAGRTAESHKIHLERERKRQATLDQLAAAKVSIIKSDGWQPSGGPYFELGKGWGRLPMNTAAHAKEPCHAAWVDADGKARYVCTKPANHLRSSIKAIAKAAKVLSSKGGRSNTTREGKAAQAKAAETRERNKALRVAEPIRLKLAVQLLKPSKVRRESLDFAIRQLIQIALDSKPELGRIAARLLDVKAKDRDGDPSFKAYVNIDTLAYALGIAAGEAPFAQLTARSYFPEEYSSHAARYFAHLKTAGNYKATPTELAQLKTSSWRGPFDR